MDTFERYLGGEGPIRSRLRILYEAGWAWVDGRGIRLGAAVAYYGLFALVPVLALAMGLASIFLGEANVRTEIESELADLLGTEAAERVMEFLGQIDIDNSGVLLSLIGFGVLLFSATLLFVAWKEMVDLMWGVPRERGARGLVRRRLFGVLAVLGAGVLMTANLMIGTVVAVLERLFESNLVSALLTSAGSIVPLVIGVFFVGVLYKYTPDVDVAWRSVWMGSIVSMALLLAGSWAYGIYVENYGFRSATGVAGTALFGLVLVYYAAMILLYGMEIVRQTEMANHRP